MRLLCLCRRAEGFTPPPHLPGPGVWRQCDGSCLQQGWCCLGDMRPCFAVSRLPGSCQSQGKRRILWHVSQPCSVKGKVVFIASIYLGMGLGHFIWCSLQSSCSVLRRRKTSDSCSLFQTRESKAIDTMASLVTGRVPGAGKFPTQCPRSKWQDSSFLLTLRLHLVNRYLLVLTQSLVQIWGWGLQLRGAPESSCHIAVDFPM